VGSAVNQWKQVSLCRILPVQKDLPAAAALSFACAFCLSGLFFLVSSARWRKLATSSNAIAEGITNSYVPVSASCVIRVPLLPLPCALSRPISSWQRTVAATQKSIRLCHKRAIRQPDLPSAFHTAGIQRPRDAPCPQSLCLGN
jgi:hypothetical protein